MFTAVPVDPQDQRFEDRRVVLLILLPVAPEPARKGQPELGDVAAAFAAGDLARSPAGHSYGLGGAAVEGRRLMRGCIAQLGYVGEYHRFWRAFPSEALKRKESRVKRPPLSTGVTSCR